jgi:hypothetical protein
LGNYRFSNHVIIVRFFLDGDTSLLVNLISDRVVPFADLILHYLNRWNISMNILSGPFNPFFPDGNDLLFVFLCDKLYFVHVFDAIFDIAAVFLELQPRLSTLPHKLVLVEISFGVFNHFLPFLSMQRG